MTSLQDMPVLKPKLWPFNNLFLSMIFVNLFVNIFSIIFLKDSSIVNGLSLSDWPFQSLIFGINETNALLAPVGKHITVRISFIKFKVGSNNKVLFINILYISYGTPEGPGALLLGNSLIYSFNSFSLILSIKLL